MIWIKPQIKNLKEAKELMREKPGIDALLCEESMVEDLSCNNTTIKDLLIKNQLVTINCTS